MDESVSRIWRVATYVLPATCLLETRSLTYKVERTTAAEKYILKDPAGEQRWGFKLADALGRAKEADHKIFTGYNFHVTKSTSPEFKVLEKVIASAGGKVRSEGLVEFFHISLINQIWLVGSSSIPSQRAHIRG